MSEPIVFIPAAGSWDRFSAFFAQRGYATLTPELRVQEIVGELDEPPIVIGHSVGGLIAQGLLADGLVRAAVAIAPASGAERFDREDRGPLLIAVGEHDQHQHPRSAATTEFVVFPGLSHLLMEGDGWEDVAQYAADWLDRVLRPAPV
jgi:pimeloyl-ACP methyl ester carboxylesterase